MSIVEELKKEMTRSDDYARRNFGAKYGEGFPDFAREITRDKDVAGLLFGRWMIDMLQSQTTLKALRSDRPADICELLGEHPGIYENFLSFVYWGVEIGRTLEKEEARALQAIADGAQESAR